MEYFVAGTTARCAADIVGVNVKTAIYYFHRLRQIICNELLVDSAQYLAGEIEVDESYFGGVQKGKRGRGAAGKIPINVTLKLTKSKYSRGQFDP